MGGYGVLFVDTLYNMGRCIVTYRIREDIQQKNGYFLSETKLVSYYRFWFSIFPLELYDIIILVWAKSKSENCT